jgi:hypothetical protein
VDLGDALEVTLEVTRVFEALAVPYLLGGSLASSFYGLPRATQDADIVADLQIVHISPLAEALRPRFYLDEERMRDSIRRRASFNLIHLETNLKVDVFVLANEAFARSEMARRRSVAFRGAGGESSLQVASPEDLIVQKLRWFELGGGASDRQWNDLLGVLKVQGTRLDMAYLERWSREIGVEELLARALAEAKPS